ncbi:lytic transglycosylase domain-containing protein [Nitrincola sp.]|uniref:lytic transglycosylase domain-containing protein n=1 Tax=Nitrincola sp. TaxID=1926584 RepID=UPI003A9184BD
MPWQNPMRALFSLLVVGLITSLLLTSLSQADSGIRRIVHPDGRVEFTNVGSAPANTAATTTPSQTIYSYRTPGGTMAFSDQRPAEGIRYDTLRFDCYACKPGSTINWHNTRLFASQYKDEIEREAQRFNVDPALVRAVIHAESAFNPQARSPKGAQGLMQLMPPTAADLGVTNAMDVSQNIYGGVKYLSWMLERFNGDTRLATAAYNAGPGAVQQYGGIPPFAETQAYTERVAILHQRYRQLY